MFAYCNTLKDINELKYLNTKYYTNFSRMFYHCESLKDINELNYLNTKY